MHVRIDRCMKRGWVDECVHVEWVYEYSMGWMHVLRRSRGVNWLKTLTLESAWSQILALFFINCELE